MIDEDVGDVGVAWRGVAEGLVAAVAEVWPVVVHILVRALGQALGWSWEEYRIWD